MIHQEFVTYLKENTGFQRFKKAWIQQYKKLGRLGGSITLTKPSEIEKEAIGGFVGTSYRNNDDIRVSYTRWQKAIESSKFEGSDFLQVLELYEGTEILTNKELRQQKTHQEQCAFNQLLSTFKNTKVEEWLVYILYERNKSYTKIKQMIHDKQVEKLHFILKGINELPLWNEKSENFAIFATRISGDPHFFDKGNQALLLYESILFFKNMDEEERTLEEKNKIYYDAGLLKDDLSNNCMLCHINALDYNDTIHEAWNGFYKHYEPWIVNLYNMQQIKKIMNGIKVVFIVENPSVFKSLCLAAKQLNIEKSGFICTNGQLNLCAFILLDFINKSDIKMYYAGDFDPEGLLIADKLKRRYAENLVLWHYSESDYKNSLSIKQADERRLAMLGKCESADLQVIKDCILKTTNCGYQEALIDCYRKDVENMETYYK